MISNTDAQRDLHPELVGGDARMVIDVARANGALGWKVNGAGGDGGSLTLLCGTEMQAKDQLIRAVTEISPRFRVIPIRLSRHGVRVR
jgi:D-glycero-alpha-D-manno-heptose-7-phosphate kinase